MRPKLDLGPGHAEVQSRQHISRRESTQIENQAGFTMLELSIGLAIMAIIVIYTTPNLIEDLNEKRANITAQETQTLIDAARTYRIREGKWPGNATCADAFLVLQNTVPPFLTGAPEKNRFNSLVTPSCTQYTFSIDQTIIKDWSGVVANLLPSTKEVDTSKSLIRTTIGIPGTEPALDSKLSRIATGNAELNRMRTELLLGGNDISEVNEIAAVSGVFSGNLSVKDATLLHGLLTAEGESQFMKKAVFNDSVVLTKIVTAKTPCPENGALARDATGMTLSCQNGQWAGNGGLEGPYAVTGSNLGAWKMCTLNYGSGNAKSLSYSGGNWYYSGSGTQIVYCYR